MEHDSIDMEDDLNMTVSIWKMTESIWRMKVSTWDILSLCARSYLDAGGELGGDLLRAHEPVGDGVDVVPPHRAIPEDYFCQVTVISFCHDIPSFHSTISFGQCVHTHSPVFGHSDQSGGIVGEPHSEI